MRLKIALIQRGHKKESGILKAILISITIILVCSTYVSAQQHQLRQGCEFLKNLHFKNGVDTIIVLGYKISSVRSPPYGEDVLNTLHRKRLLNKSKFNYIALFKPENCSETYNVFCGDTSRFAFDVQDYHKPVYMGCTVFYGYSFQSHPYFVIDKITPVE